MYTMTLSEIATKYRSPVWIATVLDQGDVLKIGDDANYAHVVGATTSREDANYCQERFKGHPRIRIFHGEDIILHEVIRDINVPITFCLDARSEPAPALIQELGILKHHRIKTHTILVRNLALFGTQESGFITFDQVRSAIRLVNSDYRFIDLGDVLACVFP